MKTHITLIIMFLSIQLFANNCTTNKAESSIEEQLEISTDVPVALRGATVTVRQANGKEYKFSSEQFKVVPRKQQFIVTKTKEIEQLVCFVASKSGTSEKDKNRISLLGGSGPKGNLKLNQTTPGQVSIETNPSAVGGVMYQRNVTDKVSIGGQLQTNESILFSIGLDF